MKPLAASAALVLVAATALAVAQAPKPAASPGASPVVPAPTVQQCIACHGAQGAGNPQGGIPRIAGQPEAYLRKQLDSYADGSRRNAVMQPIAKALSREARAAGAAYYAALAPAATGTPAAQGGKADATTGSEKAESNAGAGRPATSRGEVLATVGDERGQVQACGNCHGPGGIGEPPGVPYLAGQDAAYLTAALNEFRNGARRNDAGAQMRTVVDGLSTEDIASVAQYYARLAPPAQPAPHNVVRAPTEPVLTSGAAARGPSKGGATTATQSTAGPAGAVGSEQGAGTTGGTQGPGGIDQGSRIDKPAPAKGR